MTRAEHPYYEIDDDEIKNRNKYEQLWKFAYISSQRERDRKHVLESESNEKSEKESKAKTISPSEQENTILDL